jgi:uncharacterized SAM-binding protein YcdF (DUF218 family)
MYFIAKLAHYLVNPNTWLLLLLLWAYLTKNEVYKKRLTISCIILFFILTNGALYKKVMYWWQPTPVELTNTYDAGIVLTGMAGFGPDGKGYFGNSSDRFIQTLKLYNQGIIKKIIVSGGDGTLGQQNPKEADFLRDEFIKNKVPAKDIITENQSRNTYENTLNSKKITDSLHFNTQVVLITSAIHMPRASALFKKAGFSYVIYPSNYIITDNSFEAEDFIPNFGLIERWNSVFKEWMGIIAYKISGKA